MDLQPRLIPTHAPRRPEGAVLVLHGGAAREGSMRVSATQLSVLRMVPVARRLARAGRGRLVVYRLLNSARGWDARRTPVDDVRWALGQLQERHGALPTALVGHSLGGRAALLAGRHDGVRAVCALNAWVYPHDDVPMTGRRILFVHGTEDRVAPLERAETVARRVARANEVEFRRVEGGRHAMLRHARDFETAAAGFAATALLDGEPPELRGRPGPRSGRPTGPG